MIQLPYIDHSLPTAELRAQLRSTRHYIRCPSTDNMYSDIGAPYPCDNCGCFLGLCCCQLDYCHGSRVVYVDGACSRNGSVHARSAIGLAYGTEPSQQFSTPIEELQDPGKPRTNQRAELLAAYYGLQALELARLQECSATLIAEESAQDHPPEQGRELWIIAMDSEYVVRGMAEWMPKWEARGWLNSSNVTPTNLDLFRKLMDLVERCERKHDIYVKFWWIPRELNVVADRLAKDAVQQTYPRMESRAMSESVPDFYEHAHKRTRYA